MAATASLKDEILTSKTAGESTSLFLSDNPCWGDSKNCNLSDLLQRIQRHSVILQETPSYILLNKPPDLRMDGNYRATVHKLLLYYYPPKSLSCCEDADDNEQKDDGKRTLLLNKIAALHKFNEPNNNPFRPVHQLDYATSGCLLVCRTKQAAKLASESLSNRRHAEKKYLAVLHGHVDIMRSWPILSAAQFQETFQSIEYNYRRARKREQDATFEGYLPFHAVFVQWKSQYSRKVKEGASIEEKHTAKKKRRKETIDVLALWKELDLDSLTSLEDQAKLIQQSWKTVKTNNVYLDAFERLTNAYNDRIRGTKGGAHVSTSATLPRIFRVQGEEDEAFYMFGALAEVPHEFSMCLESEDPTSKDTDPMLDFKPSLTRCVVLHRGTMNKIGAVTKVQMEPKTGRRHQLRVHASHILGHAIVGDMTYATTSNGGEQKDRCATTVSLGATGFARMCLHAHSLKLPPLLNETITTPDPFPVDNETGEVNVELV